MRQIWIEEVRYYKYILMCSIFLLFCGLYLTNEYHQQNNNTGKVVNIIYMQNITYQYPIFKVQKDNNIIYNVYDKCILTNITSCSEKQIHHYHNNIIYFEYINGLYILSNKNNFLLFVATFSLAISFLSFMIVTIGYTEYIRLRMREKRVWGMSKKNDTTYDASYIEDFPSIIFN